MHCKGTHSWDTTLKTLRISYVLHHQDSSLCNINNLARHCHLWLHHHPHHNNNHHQRHLYLHPRLPFIVMIPQVPSHHYCSPQDHNHRSWMVVHLSSTLVYRIAITIIIININNLPILQIGQQACPERNETTSFCKSQHTHKHTSLAPETPAKSCQMHLFPFYHAHTYMHIMHPLSLAKQHENKKKHHTYTPSHILPNTLYSSSFFLFLFYIN